jgi:acyl carrier protein
VKVRGYRVEVGEVEAAVSKHPAVRDVVVLAREEKEGEGKQLIAYVVGDEPHGVTLKDLRAYVKERLPEYMVPSVFILLDRFPLTPNGKVDTRALPPPGAANRESEKTYEAPRNHVEQTIALIWSELLHVERVGINDNFFELGGHSIFVIQLLSRLNKAFNLDLPLRVIYDWPTPAELALAVIEKQAEQADSSELRKLLAELEGISDDEAQKMEAADPAAF